MAHVTQLSNLSWAGSKPQVLRTLNQCCEALQRFFIYILGVPFWKNLQWVASVFELSNLCFRFSVGPEQPCHSHLASWQQPGFESWQGYQAYLEDVLKTLGDFAPRNLGNLGSLSDSLMEEDLDCFFWSIQAACWPDRLDVRNLISTLCLLPIMWRYHNMSIRVRIWCLRDLWMFSPLIQCCKNGDNAATAHTTIETIQSGTWPAFCGLFMSFFVTFRALICRKM